MFDTDLLLYCASIESLWGEAVRTTEDFSVQRENTFCDKNDSIDGIGRGSWVKMKWNEKTKIIIYLRWQFVQIYCYKFIPIAGGVITAYSSIIYLHTYDSFQRQTFIFPEIFIFRHRPCQENSSALERFILFIIPLLFKYLLQLSACQNYMINYILHYMWVIFQ